MKIGDLALAAQCSVEAIRYYEKQGLLPPVNRRENNYRVYGPGHLEKLVFIRNCRALDMSQKEVEALLNFMQKPAGDCHSVNTVLDEHISHVDQRIKELRALKRELIVLRQKCLSTSKVSDCRILQGISSMRPKARAAASHL